MKKVLSLMLLCALLCCSFSITALAAGTTEAQLSYVTDECSLLSSDEKAALEKNASEISTAYSCGVYIIIVDDYSRYTTAYDVYSAAEQLYDNYHLGYSIGEDGVLLLLSMNARDFALVAGGENGNRIFNNAGMTALENVFLDDFKLNSWYTGLNDYISECGVLLQSPPQSSTYVNPGVTGHNYDSTGNIQTEYVQKKGITPGELFIIIAIPLLIAAIVCAVLKGQMRNVAVKTQAADYLDSRNIVFTDRRDIFTHRTEQRQPIPQNQPGSNRGGSFSSASHSSGHSGHSGKF